MAAITDLSDLVNRATGGNSGTPETVFFHKQPRTAGVAGTNTIGGRPASLWRYDGQPSAGAVPGATAIPTSATAGAMPFTNPGGSREKWMIQAFATGLVAGTLIIYDRLLHVGGFSGVTATAQTVQGTPTPTPALTRHTDGVGNMVFAEIYTIIGASTSSITMNYTNQAGTDGRTSTAVQIGNTGFREVTRALFLPLASGDTGVRAVNSVIHATTGTAGSYGITIGHPIAYIGIGAAGQVGWRDFTTGMPGLPEVETDACLALLWIPNTTTVPEFFGGFSMVEA